jgi:hypothetical protein
MRESESGGLYVEVQLGQVLSATPPFDGAMLEHNFDLGMRQSSF